MTAKETDKIASKLLEKMQAYQPVKPANMKQIGEVLGRSDKWVQYRINQWVAAGFIKEIPKRDAGPRMFDLNSLDKTLREDMETENARIFMPHSEALAAVN